MNNVVKMRTILVSIIDRLRRFSVRSADAANTARDTRAFHVFRVEIPAAMGRQGTILPLIRSRRENVPPFR